LKPVPLSGTVCGEPAALSVVLNVAVRDPCAPGVKLKVMVQLAAGATDPPHSVAGVVKKPKSPALVPVMLIAEMVSVLVPVFTRVTVCGAAAVCCGTVPKFTLPGVKVIPGETPAPLSGRVCGEPVALSVMLKVAARAPSAPGVK